MCTAVNAGQRTFTSCVPTEDTHNRFTTSASAARTVHRFDEDGIEVDFTGPTTMGLASKNYPLAKGLLKASHRTKDEARSSDYTVKHTHLKADYRPLRPGEIVAVEIEIIPNTALIRKGHRIRVDIQPFDGFGHGTRHSYDEAHHKDVEYAIYTGPEHPSFIQLPIVPAK